MGTISFSLPDEIGVRFDYHKPNDAQQERMAWFRQQFKALAVNMQENLPPCREASLALTALEQAQFYVNAAIARRGGDDATGTPG